MTVGCIPKNVVKLLLISKQMAFIEYVKQLSINAKCFGTKLIISNNARFISSNVSVKNVCGVTYYYYLCMYATWPILTWKMKAFAASSTQYIVNNNNNLITNEGNANIKSNIYNNTTESVLFAGCCTCQH